MNFRKIRRVILLLGFFGLFLLIGVIKYVWLNFIR
jgi:hypothetical protein